MNDLFVDRLSEYLDGELSPAERAAVDVHLAECAACRTTLAELRQVVARAAALQDSAPDRDLWPGIAARVALVGRASVSVFRRALTSRLSFTLPQLAAAGLALMVLSGGLVWLAKSGDPRADFQPLSAQDNPAVSVPANGDAAYNDTVTALEAALASKRARLDPRTLRTLDENLAAIDRAIEQSRRALEGDPSNVYLKAQLTDARQRKLSLLRRAISEAGDQ